MTAPNCKGDWEMWFSDVSRQKQRAWVLVNCYESKVVECVGLLIYIANVPCPAVSSRKESVGLSKRKETAL